MSNYETMRNPYNRFSLKQMPMNAIDEFCLPTYI